MINYPEGWHLFTNDTAIATTLTGVPTSVLFGPIAGYNVANILSFILTGLSMYWWMYRNTKNISSSLIAGIAFAFSNNRIAHYISGHQNLLGTAWFPTLFISVQETLNIKHNSSLWNSIWPLLLGATSIGLIAFSSYYYLFFTAMILIVFYFAFFIFSFKRIRILPIIKYSALMILLATPPLYYALKPIIQISRNLHGFTQSIEYMASLSASLNDLFFPTKYHPILGGFLEGVFSRSLWMEASLYIGIVTLFLASVAIINIKYIGDNQTFIYKSILISLVFALVVTLGPYIKWNNEILLLDGQPIKLISYYLYNYVPFFSKLRSISRIGVYISLFLAFFAGHGWYTIQKYIRGRFKFLISSVIIILLIIDNYQGQLTAHTSSIPSERKVDVWLAQQAGNGAMVEMPFEKSADHNQLLFSLSHKKPIVGGHFTTSYQPNQYIYLHDKLNEFPDIKSISIMRSLNVRYILINVEEYTNVQSVNEILQGNGYILKYSIDGIEIFEDEKGSKN